jgi:hypothetical protein
MKKLILGLAAAALCSAGALAASHTPIAITGCVHAAAEPDTYVLFDVDEVTDGHAVPAGAVYSLSSIKGLKPHVGHIVEVRGTYWLDRGFGRTAGLRVDKASIKDELRAVGTTGVLPTKLKQPYRKLDVNSVKMIRANCDVP